MKKNRIITIGTAATPTRADSDFGHSYVDSLLYTNIFDPVIRYDTIPYSDHERTASDDIIMDDDRTFIPNLCESWSESSDHTHLKFRLREGIRSHWNNELTTRDTRYTIDRGFLIKASIFYYLNSFAGLPSSEYCRIIDDHTFEFYMPHPTGVALKLLSSPWIAHIDHKIAQQHSTSEDPWSIKWMTRNSCSWGPFRITGWQSNVKVTCQACDNYWQGRPRIDKVVLTSIPDRAKRVSMLEQGDIQIADRLLPRDIEYLQGKKGIRVVSTKSTGVYQLIMNCSCPPFDDVRVRRAMNYACPQDEIIRRVFHGLAEPMRSPCSPLQPGFTDEFWEYSYNPDTAARLLDEAGYGKGFEVELSFTDNSPAEEEVCILVKNALKAIHVNVTLKRYPMNKFNEKLYRKEHIFASKFTFTAVRDPAYWGLWFKGGTFLNYQDLIDPDLDALLDQQSRIIDTEERALFSRQVQKKILDLAPMVFICYPKTNIALKDTIGGMYHINPDCISYYWKDLAID